MVSRRGSTSLAISRKLGSPSGSLMSKGGSDSRWTPAVVTTAMTESFTGLASRAHGTAVASTKRCRRAHCRPNHGTCLKSRTATALLTSRNICTRRLLKKAHLLRWRPRPHAQRTESTPRVRPSGAALHLDLFEQPASFPHPARSLPSSLAGPDDRLAFLHLIALHGGGDRPVKQSGTRWPHHHVQKIAVNGLPAQRELGQRDRAVPRRAPLDADPPPDRDPDGLVQPLVRDVSEEIAERGPLENVAQRCLPLGEELALVESHGQR